MKKIIFITFIMSINLAYCNSYSKESAILDNIYITKSNKSKNTLKLWDSFLPYLLEYCEKDSESEIIIRNRKVGKYFSDEGGTLEAINFGISHLRYSLIRGISDYSGILLKNDDKLSAMENKVIFVLMCDKNDVSILEKAFKKTFKIELLTKKYINKTERLLGNPVIYDLKDNYFFAYNSNAIEKAFLSIYIEPDSILFGYKSQKLYDKIFKKYFRELSYITSILLTQKSYIHVQSKEYLLQYQNNINFDAIGFTLECRDYIFNESKNHKLMLEFNEIYPSGPYSHQLELFSKRIMGILLRRDADNSLSTVLKVLRTILYDYDNEFYSKINYYLSI